LAAAESVVASCDPATWTPYHSHSGTNTSHTIRERSVAKARVEALPVRPVLLGSHAGVAAALAALERHASLGTLADHGLALVAL
jgi:hypothetical protein